MEIVNEKFATEIFELSKNIKCMSALSAEALARLSSVGVKCVFKPNSYIWQMGEPSEYIAVVVKGLVEVRRFTGKNEETCLGFFGPSDVIGLSALINKKPYPGNAKALATETTIVKFYIRSVLQARDLKTTELQSWTHEMFVAHEQVLRDKIDILNAGRVEDRIFEFLNHLVRRFGHFDSKVSCRIPVSLTRAQVGAMVNGRVETIIRLVNRWQKEGLIKWKKNEIILLNMPLLQKSIDANQGLR